MDGDADGIGTGRRPVIIGHNRIKRVRPRTLFFECNGGSTSYFRVVGVVPLDTLHRPVGIGSLRPEGKGLSGLHFARIDRNGEGGSLIGCMDGDADGIGTGGSAVVVGRHSIEGIGTCGIFTKSQRTSTPYVRIMCVVPFDTRNRPVGIQSVGREGKGLSGIHFGGISRNGNGGWRVLRYPIMTTCKRYSDQ